VNGHWYVLHGMNPEPWAIGPISVGRNKTGKMYPIVGQNTQLRSFQNAVKEAIADAAVMIDGPLELRFYFWRRLDSYQGARIKITKNEVDATNMQKATEDALQDLITPNDKLVHRILTTIVEQGTEVDPKIVIFAAPWGALDPSEIPNEVWERIDQAPELNFNEDNSWPPRS
jgi:Holliday junction resolvase RusA-like endonuclease